MLTGLFLSSILTKEARSQTRVVGVSAELLLRCIGGEGLLPPALRSILLHGVRRKGLKFRSSMYRYVTTIHGQTSYRLPHRLHGGFTHFTFVAVCGRCLDRPKSLAWREYVE
jgi:hypothetical protein